MFEDDLDVEQNEVEEIDNGLSGEEELAAAIKSLISESDEDDEEELQDDPEFDDSDEEELDNELDEEEIDEELEPETDKEKGTKREQSREENAKFAALRRQEQIEKQVQDRLDAMRDELPEFKLAKQLSEIYGVPPEQLVEQMQEAALQKEADESNLPIELLRERQAEKAQLNSVQEELNKIRFENWQSKIESESNRMKTDYPMLNQDDMDAAVKYILHEAKNVDMPLEQAVYALHGKRIIEGLANAKVQDNLANESGRKRKTPLAPNSGKTPKAGTLTAEERTMAKMFNMSESDYLKYK